MFTNLPPGWILAPVYARFSLQLGKMLDEKRISGNQLRPYLRNIDVQWASVNTVDLPEMDFNDEERQRLELRKGDLLVCEGGEVGRTAIWDGAMEGCYFQKAIHRLRPLTGMDDPRFFRYFMRAAAQSGLFSLATASTIQHLPADKLRLIRYPSPPPEVQKAIADYLDRETGRIDALLDAKRRLLDLIAEMRQTTIALAITRGIDDAAKMRNSGVQWLGEIPAHWEIERARWLFRERDVRSKTGNEELLTVSHITGVTPRSEKEVNMFEAQTTEGYKLCEPGDLVINTLWAWMGAMGIAPIKGIVSPSYNVYETRPRVLPAYVDALVRLPVFAQEVTRFSKGVWSSRLRLYPEAFFEIHMPVPPLEEQQAISERIAHETAKLENLQAVTERTIVLLTERRAALIAAAVAGQINVGEAA